MSYGSSDGIGNKEKRAGFRYIYHIIHCKVMDNMVIFDCGCKAPSFLYNHIS